MSSLKDLAARVAENEKSIDDRVAEAIAPVSDAISKLGLPLRSRHPFLRTSDGEDDLHYCLAVRGCELVVLCEFWPRIPPADEDDNACQAHDDDEEKPREMQYLDPVRLTPVLAGAMLADLDRFADEYAKRAQEHLQPILAE